MTRPTTGQPARRRANPPALRSKGGPSGGGLAAEAGHSVPERRQSEPESLHADALIVPVHQLEKAVAVLRHERRETVCRDADACEMFRVGGEWREERDRDAGGIVRGHDLLEHSIERAVERRLNRRSGLLAFDVNTGPQVIADAAPQLGAH